MRTVGTTLRLLLAEDSEDDMLLLLHALRTGGYDLIHERVQTATAMSAALDSASWDIVIADYFMPKFSALEALNLLQSRNLDLPFIVISGAIGEDTAVAVMKAGAHDFLLKDNLARLIPAIERELREAETRRAKQAAEAALHEAYEGLEVLVKQRTAELESTNRALQAEVDERIRAGRRMAAQHHITQILAESKTLNGATPQILRAVCKHLGWDLGQVWLVDTHDNALRLIETWHSENTAFPNFNQACHDLLFTLGMGMLGKIWQTQRPMWITDIATDPRFINADKALQDHIFNASGFPIISGEEVLGVMTFFCRMVRPADPELLKVMRAIGSQVGQFIKRRQAEEALHQLAAIVESSDDAIISTSFDWTIISWNAGAEKMYGYSADEAIGQKLGDLIKPSHIEASQPAIAINHQKVDHQLAIHQRQDGSLVDVFLTISPVKDSTTGRITGASMIAKDISHRRAVEKMKDEFVSIVSHELRTPLTSIRGSLGLLLTGKLGDLSVEGNRFLQIAVNNTDRLVRLINDILDLERLESGKVSLTKEVCNIGDLITQAAEVMHTMANKANVTLNVAAIPVYLSVDPDRILQTLTNLLSNAIKFSPPETTVELSAELLQDSWLKANPHWESHLSLPLLQSSLLITVKDQGRGIPSNKLEHIFERFQQVDASDARQKGGTGLGLAICRSIIQQHGGNIWVESELNQGSTFFLALPIDQPDLSIPQDLPITDSILVCDRLLSRYAGVQALLEQQNYQVTQIDPSRSLIEQAIALHPTVILLDLTNPNFGGWEIVTTLKQTPQTKDLPVIVLGEFPPEVQISPPPNGCNWLDHPLDQTTLLQALERILKQRGQANQVLIVEDDHDLAHILLKMLESHGIVAFHAHTAEDAIQLCQRVTPDLMILDLVLQESSGFAVVDWLRQSEQLKHTPLVVYSAKDLDDWARSRLQLGQTQFLTKSRTSPEHLEQQVVMLLNRII